MSSPVAHEDKRRPVIRMGVAGWSARRFVLDDDAATGCATLRFDLAEKQVELGLAQRLNFGDLAGAVGPALIEVAHELAGAGVVDGPERGDDSLRAFELRGGAEAIYLAAVTGTAAHAGLAGGEGKQVGVAEGKIWVGVKLGDGEVESRAGSVFAGEEEITLTVVAGTEDEVTGDVDHAGPRVELVFHGLLGELTIEENGSGEDAVGALHLRVFDDVVELSGDGGQRGQILFVFAGDAHGRHAEFA